ncbi:hypothetical protein SAMN02745866_01139 [Alteromonadaceae bacterium Bs31]|nr:hypothetical protein SAMN02745866_01139 [Alteromonadaceae bacterium Bs31]
MYASNHALFLCALSVFLVMPANALELKGLAYGKNNFPKGARLEVTCDSGFSKSIAVNNNQSFSMRGIPSGLGCNYRVLAGKTGSNAITIDTSQAVVQAQIEVRQINSALVIVSH